MKRFLVILFMLSCCMYGFSDSLYWIVHDSIYQIFKKPDVHSEVICTTEGKSLLNLVELKNEWAKVKIASANDTVGYVKSSCFGSIENNEKVKEERVQSYYDKISWRFYAVVFLTIILCLLSILRYFTYLTGILYYILLVSFGLLSILWPPFIFECFDKYGLMDYLFCNHPLSAFLSIIVVPFIHLLIFWKLKGDIERECDTTLNVWIGVCSMFVCFAVFILSAIFYENFADVEVYLNWTLIVTALCQVIQSGLIFKSIKKNKSVIYAILCVLIYLIGLIASSVALLGVIFIALLILWTYFLIKFGIFLIRRFIEVMLTPPPPPNYPYYY